MATNHHVVATDDDQARQGEIDHGEETLPPGDHGGVLIRISGRRLGENIERVANDGTDHGL